MTDLAQEMVEAALQAMKDQHPSLPTYPRYVRAALIAGLERWKGDVEIRIAATSSDMVVSAMYQDLDDEISDLIQALKEGE